MNTNNILGPHYCICSDDQAIFTDNHIYRKMKNLNNTHDIYVLTLLNNQFVWNKTNDCFYVDDINNSNITTENFSDLRCIIKDNNNLTIYRIYEDMITDYINVINFPNENRTDSWRQWEKLNPPLDINELKTMSLLDIPSHIDLTNEEMEEEENQTETYSEGIPLDINFEPLFGWENLLERNPPDDINFKNKNLFNKDISFDDLELNIPNVEYRYDPYDNEWFTKEEFLDYYGGLVEWNNQDPKLVLRREQYYQFSETFKNLSDKRFKFLFNKYEKTFV